MTNSAKWPFSKWPANKNPAKNNLEQAKIATTEGIVYMNLRPQQVIDLLKKKQKEVEKRPLLAHFGFEDQEQSNHAQQDPLPAIQNLLQTYAQGKDQGFIVKEIGLVGKLFGKTNAEKLIKTLKQLQDYYQIPVVPTIAISFGTKLFIIQPQLITDPEQIKQKFPNRFEELEATLANYAEKYQTHAREVLKQLGVQLDYIGNAGILCALRGKCNTLLSFMTNVGVDANGDPYFFDPIAWILNTQSKETKKAMPSFKPKIPKLLVYSLMFIQVFAIKEFLKKRNNKK